VRYLIEERRASPFVRDGFGRLFHETAEHRSLGFTRMAEADQVQNILRMFALSNSITNNSQDGTQTYKVPRAGPREHFWKRQSKKMVRISHNAPRRPERNYKGKSKPKKTSKSTKETNTQASQKRKQTKKQELE
jgi:hypothetical protein